MNQVPPPSGGPSGRFRRLSGRADATSPAPEEQAAVGGKFSRTPQPNTGAPVRSGGFRPQGAGAAPAVPEIEAEVVATAPPVGFRRRLVDPSVPASWETWGLPNFDQPEVLAEHAHALPGVLAEGDTWRFARCPRCSRAGKESLSLLVHSEGRFLCAQCGWQGDARVVPSRHLGTWLEGFVHFFTNVATPPDQSPRAWPGEVPVQQFGALMSAPVWCRDSLTWRQGWWLTVQDDSTRLRAAWQGVPLEGGSMSWSRPAPMPSVPLGTWSAFRPADPAQSDALRVGGVSGGRSVILSARVEDYLALLSAGLDRVVCLPPGLDPALPNAPAWQFAEVWDNEHCLADSDELILAIPATARALEEELGRRLSRDRCFRVRYSLPEELPLGEVPDEEHEGVDVVPDVATAASQLGLDALVDMVSRAHPFPVKGIHELDDIDDAFETLYRFGLQPGRSTGFPSLDQFYTVMPGQWTLVTGIPGHGKSSWLDGLMLNLAKREGWRFGIFSPENQPPERHFAGLMEKLLDKPFSEGYAERISVAEKNAAKRWLNDRFKVILPDENEGEWSLDAILALAKILVRRYGIQGLVIDPWNEVDHSAAGDKEVSYLSQALTKIRRFARLHGVHVWIVAHPTKLSKQQDGLYPVPTPYDVAGGAHWRNKADNVISIYRFVGQADQDIADVHVQKIRFREVGRVGLGHLRTNPQTGAWIDDVDYDRRAYNLDKSVREDFRNQILPQPRRPAPQNAQALAASDLL